jgi:hypothetical protein
MRFTWIKLHLIAASFFSLVLLTMAVSGGGYLLDFKGETTATVIPADAIQLDFESATLEADVRQALETLGIEHPFEYLRTGGTTTVTRPTSKTYYEFKQVNDAIVVTRHEPDLQKVLVELHKGHGPQLFKTFQKFMAVGLVFVLLTGLWLGISSKGLRTQTAISAGAGMVVFVLLAFVI